MQTLDELKESYKAAQDALHENADATVNASVKIQATENLLATLRGEEMEAKARKEEVLDQLSKGKATDEDLIEAKRALKIAGKKLEDAHELLDAVKKRRDTFSQERSQLVQKVEVARRAFWGFVYNQVKTDIQEALGDNVCIAYAVKNLEAGGGTDFLMTAADMLGGLPPAEKIAEWQAVLGRQYLGE